MALKGADGQVTHVGKVQLNWKTGKVDVLLAHSGDVQSWIRSEPEVKGRALRLDPWQPKKRMPIAFHATGVSEG